MKLYLTPCPPEVFSAVCQLHAEHGLPPPAPSKRNLTIMAEGPILVGWVGLYECDAFLLAESFILNPRIPPKVRWQAATMLVEGFIGMAAAGGQTAIAAPRSSGLAAMLRKSGFHNSGVPMYVASFPAVQLTTEKKTAVGERGDPTTVPTGVTQSKVNVSEPKKPRKRVSARRGDVSKAEAVPGAGEGAR